jgi:hypothetical protein
LGCPLHNVKVQYGAVPRLWNYLITRYLWGIGLESGIVVQEYPLDTPILILGKFKILQKHFFGRSRFSKDI